jgi:tRNA A-37 threonylcarbamoyl transferase component Bud32
MSGAVLSNQNPSAGRPAESSGVDSPLSDETTGEFVHVESAGVAWTLRADLASQLVPGLRKAADNPASDRSVETVKTGPHRTVYRLSLAAGEFYLKHFRINNWKTLLLNALRPAKADLEWHAALRIARLGLPTFEPVALGQIRRGGLIADSFLVSRGIPQAIPLDEFASVTFQTPMVQPTPSQQAPSQQAPSQQTPSQQIAESATSGPVNKADPNQSGLGKTDPGARRQSELRQHLAAGLGDLTGRLHLAAVDHVDLHAANVLVRIGADNLPALWLIDLHRVYFRRALSQDQRFNNLAFLHQYFTDKSTRTDRLRFYRAYQRVVRDGATLPMHRVETPRCIDMSHADRAEIAALENCLTAGAHRGWKRADRAWRRGNRHVRKLDGAAGGCRGIAALNLAWLTSVRDDPEMFFRENVLVWHKQTAKHRVAQIGLDNPLVAPEGCAFFKCVEQRGLVQGWLAHFRDSPVRKAWEFGHALLRRQVDTPRPILYVERRENNTRKCYLLTEAVHETVNLSEFLHSRWPRMSPSEQRAWLAVHLRRLAWQMRRLHGSGFEHRDMKFANLLVSCRTEDPRVWLLDLEGMRAWRRLPEARAVQNIARINVSALAHGIASHAVRLRFLKWYLTGQSSSNQSSSNQSSTADSSSNWKRWWRQIARISDRKFETNQRRGRAIH